MNYQSIKEKILGIAGNCKEKYGDYQENRSYTKISEGLIAIDDIQEIFSELEEKVSRGNLAIEGAYAIARRNTNHQENGDIAILSKFREQVNPKGGLLGRITRYSPWKRNTETIQDALKVIKDAAEEIPGYVNRLDSDLNERRKNLLEYRSTLRKDIQSFIQSKPELMEDIHILKEALEEGLEKYQGFENQRLKNTDNGEITPRDVLDEITNLEMVLSDGRIQYEELVSKLDSVESSVGLMSGQIYEIGQVLDQMNEIQKQANKASIFANVRAKYVVESINAQRSELKALDGVYQMSTFFNNQAELDGVVNDKIVRALDHITPELEEIRRKITNRRSIYAEESSRLIEDSHEQIIKSLKDMRDPLKEDE